MQEELLIRQSNLWIHLTDFDISRQTEIKIVDLQGRIIYKNASRLESYFYGKVSLANGFYLVTAENGHFYSVKKLIVNVI